MDDLKNSKGETSEKLFHAKSQRAQRCVFKLKYDFACPPFHHRQAGVFA